MGSCGTICTAHATAAPSAGSAVRRPAEDLHDAASGAVSDTISIRAVDLPARTPDPAPGSRAADLEVDRLHGTDRPFLAAPAAGRDVGLGQTGDAEDDFGRAGAGPGKAASRDQGGTGVPVTPVVVAGRDGWGGVRVVGRACAREQVSSFGPDGRPALPRPGSRRRRGPSSGRSPAPTLGPPPSPPPPITPRNDNPASREHRPSLVRLGRFPRTGPRRARSRPPRHRSGQDLRPSSGRRRQERASVPWRRSTSRSAAARPWGWSGSPGPASPRP